MSESQQTTKEPETKRPSHLLEAERLRPVGAKYLGGYGAPDRTLGGLIPSSGDWIAKVVHAVDGLGHTVVAKSSGEQIHFYAMPQAKEGA